MPTIIKRQVLLNRPHLVTSSSRVLFSNANLESWGDSTSVFMAQKDWEDMGEPDEITVTIEFGDQLNPEVPNRKLLEMPTPRSDI